MKRLSPLLWAIARAAGHTPAIQIGSPEDAKLKEIMLKIKASLLILLKVRNEAVIAIALGNRKGRRAYARNSDRIPGGREAERNNAKDKSQSANFAQSSQ